MNIAVYGFMGVGKSTIGRLLAEELDYGFIDMDSEIERREGAKISNIFKEKGEPYFRKIESKLLAELTELDETVIACGGGVVADKKNAESLKSSSKMIYLTATIEEILERTSKDNNRPLLDIEDPRKKALKLLEERTPVYEKYAEISVDTTGKPPSKIIDEILEALR